MLNTSKKKCNQKSLIMKVFSHRWFFYMNSYNLVTILSSSFIRLDLKDLIYTWEPTSQDFDISLEKTHDRCGYWNVAKVEILIIGFIFMLYEVLFLLYMSYSCYMFYYIFVTYLCVYYMFLNLFYISIFTLFDSKFMW